MASVSRDVLSLGWKSHCNTKFVIGWHFAARNAESSKWRRKLGSGAFAAPRGMKRHCHAFCCYVTIFILPSCLSIASWQSGNRICQRAAFNKPATERAYMKAWTYVACCRTKLKGRDVRGSWSVWQRRCWRYRSSTVLCPAKQWSHVITHSHPAFPRWLSCIWINEMSGCK